MKHKMGVSPSKFLGPSNERSGDKKGTHGHNKLGDYNKIHYNMMPAAAAPQQRRQQQQPSTFLAGN